MAAGLCVSHQHALVDIFNGRRYSCNHCIAHDKFPGYKSSHCKPRKKLTDRIKPLTMLKNYFKIAWRNLIKSKGYSALNIGGLAVGMAVALLIGLWIYD